jgi:catechol 2,3-dioxygenase-like lactoylglutathione lyase family enzyme
VSHLGLTVRNLRASEEWYVKVFGLERVHEDRGRTYESVTLQDPECEMVISLRHHHGAGSARFDETRTGLDHVSFGVPDKAALEAWELRLAEMGVDHSPVADTDFGSVLVFRDPDHIQLELFCRARPVLRVAEAPPAAAEAEADETEGAAKAADTVEPAVPAVPTVPAVAVAAAVDPIAADGVA